MAILYSEIIELTNDGISDVSNSISDVIHRMRMK